LSALISGLLIARVWIVHAGDPALKKVRWSVLLCVPLFGWIFYGAFYTPLAENTVKAPRTPGAGAIGGR
jgi:hypothetical protein